MPELNTLDIPEDATVFVCSPVADGVKDVIVSIPKTLDKLRELTLPSCKNVTLSGKITSEGAGCLLPGLKKLIIPAGVKNIIFGTMLCDTIEEIVMEGPDCVIDGHSNFGKIAITMPLSDASFDAIIGKRLPHTRRMNSYYSRVKFLIMPDQGIKYYDRLYGHLLACQGKYNSKTNYNYLSNVDTTLVFDSVDDLLGKICDGTFDRILECVSLFTKHSRGDNPKSTQLKFSMDGSESDSIFAMLTKIYENCESSIPVFRLVLKLGLASANSSNIEESLGRLLEKTNVSCFAGAVKSICDLFPEGDDLYIPFCKAEENFLLFASEWHNAVREVVDISFYHTMYLLYFLLAYWLNKLLGISCEIGDVKAALNQMYPKVMSSIFEKSDQSLEDILGCIIDIYYGVIVPYCNHMSRSVSARHLRKVLDGCGITP